ncbi:MAG: tetratricopeptide repeat protein [Candidatus Muiribacteriota bacterium]
MKKLVGVFLGLLLLIAISFYFVSQMVSDNTEDYKSDNIIDKGLKYYNEGNYEDSLLVFKKVLKENPHDMNANLMAGRASYKLGKYENAEKYYLQIYNNDSGNVNALNGLGLTKLKVGNYEKAISLFNEVTSINPGSEVANTGLARIYLNKGDYDKAKEKILVIVKNGSKGNISVSSFENNYELIKLMGRAEFGLNNYKSSLDFLKKLINKKPETNVYSLLFLTKSKVDNYESGLKYLLDGKTLFPDSYEVRDMLTWFYMENGNLEDAKFENNVSLDINDNNYVAWAWKGFIEYKEGDLIEAEEDFKKSIDLYENKNDVTYTKKPYPYSGLALVYLKKGNYSVANEFINESFKIGKDSYALGGKGIIMALNGNNKAGLEMINESLRINPLNKEFRDFYINLSD